MSVETATRVTAEYRATLQKEPNRRHSLRAVNGSSASARR